MRHNTKSDYAAYCKAVESFLEWNNVKPGCHSPTQDQSEGFFSWQPCECCGSTLGGNRETYSFAQTWGGIFEADICQDCVYFLAYGKLDDLTMMEIAEAKE